MRNISRVIYPIPKRANWQTLTPITLQKKITREKPYTNFSSKQQFRSNDIKNSNLVWRKNPPQHKLSAPNFCEQNLRLFFKIIGTIILKNNEDERCKRDYIFSLFDEKNFIAPTEYLSPIFFFNLNFQTNFYIINFDGNFLKYYPKVVSEMDSN